MKLKNNDLLPLYFMRQVPEKQLCLCFPGENNQWSSPFNLANVGMAHIKLAKHGQRQKLVRVEIILEGATLFLHFSIETKHWPFSMRNESDTEFLFFQANPNVAEDEEEDKGSGWKPIRYKLPPRSIMPYAWDYPASKNKELVLTSGGRERYIKLAEIGNLIPIKLPPRESWWPNKGHRCQYRSRWAYPDACAFELEAREITLQDQDWCNQYVSNQRQSRF